MAMSSDPDGAVGEVPVTGECMLSVSSDVVVVVWTVAGEVTMNSAVVLTVGSDEACSLVNRTVVAVYLGEDVVSPDVACVTVSVSRLVSGTLTLAGKDLSLT